MRTGCSSTLAVIAALCALILCPFAASAKQRALIIGIDEYVMPPRPVPRGNPPDPRHWRQLAGAVNDATRMQDILVARFGFQSDTIQALLNQDAKRDAILAAIHKVIETSAAGDVFFFYFAGHGSRVRNSLSHEPDHLDESIIPADAPAGARDIRDKELRDLFNKLLDAGVVLTAIFDSCHSGSVARGPLGPPSMGSRMLPIDPRDVRDASQAPNPADRGALILSASQDDAVAHEHIDAFNRAGGLFTIALNRALLAAEPGESAMNVYRRTFAYMRDTGKGQSPAIEGSAQRRNQTLLGTSISNDSQRVTVAVQSVKGKTVVIQQGIAAGMTEGTELSMVGNSSVRLRVLRVTGLATSNAEVVGGSEAAIKSGSLFSVDNWAAPAVPDLRMFASTTALSAAQLALLHGRIKGIIRARGHGWITDPTQTTPTHVITYEDDTWWLIPPAGKRQSLGNPLVDKSLIDSLGSAPAQPRPNVFLNLPLPQTLRANIRLGPDTPNTAVAWVRPEVADYHLMGRVQDGALAFSWVRPWKTDDSAVLPPRSDWVAAGSGGDVMPGSKLTTLATRLARVNAWLNLEAPPAMNPAFAYRLALKRKNADEFFEQGLAYQGESFELALVADRPPAATTARRFVYVFTIDNRGASQLIIPRSPVENRYPLEADVSPPARYTVPNTGFSIGEPFGTDTFLLVTASEPLPDPWALEWDGVRSRSPDDPPPPPPTPLGNLLTRLGSATRGQTLETLMPENWSVQRISLRTRAQR